MVWVHGVANAAGDVDTDDQRVYAFAAGGANVFSQRQNGRGHRASRVDDGFQVRVVKVKGVRGDAVDQRCAAHVDFFAATQHAGLRCGLEHLCSGQRRVSGFVVSGANSAAEPVGEGSVRVMVDGVAPAA